MLSIFLKPLFKKINMLHIQIDHLLTKKIGLLHGLSESRLRKLCASNQAFVRDVFKSKNQAGYNFVTLPDDEKNLKAVKKYSKEQEKLGWEHIVVLGIGGSLTGNHCCEGRP